MGTSKNPHFVMLALPAAAVDIAPRISDRERSLGQLAEIKAGQKSLEDKMDMRFAAIQELMDQRFEFLQPLMLAMIAGVFGLIGFIVWDGYTTLRLIDARLCRIEEVFKH